MAAYETTQTRRFEIADPFGNKRVVIATRTVISVGDIGGMLESASAWTYRTENGVAICISWPDKSTYTIEGEKGLFTSIDPNAPEDPLNGHQL